jgi:hypothetical protein
MSKEALKLALEALEDIGDEWGFTSQRTVPKRKEAITAIKAALEAKDEPYAFEASMYSNDRMKVDPVTGNVSIGTPQRTWVGLTDEEINLIYSEPQTHIGQYARAIEAKLKEKNNGETNSMVRPN